MEYVKAIEDLLVETDDCNCNEETLKKFKLEQLKDNFDNASHPYMNNLLPHIKLSDEEKQELETKRLSEVQKNTERNILKQKLLQKFTVEQFKQMILMAIDSDIENI